jgi:hypothetical protein
LARRSWLAPTSRRGRPRGKRLLLWWNGIGDKATPEPLSGGLLVAHDVVGGFFAVDGGAFGTGDGETWFLAPDTLSWQALGMGHSAFVRWAVGGDIQGFYEPLRWPGWQAEVEALAVDRGLSLVPPPWTREGKNVSAVSRKPVPMAELWGLENDMRRQLE